MSTPLVIHVHGSPAPKGSLRHIGHGRLVEQVKGSAPWRAQVAAVATSAMSGRAPFTGPVQVATIVMVPHLKKRRRWPITRSSGDIDKHARNILDALVDAGALVDDSQVVKLTVWKRYDDQPGAHITITEAES